MLTPEELRKIKIFAKYCQTFGATYIEFESEVDAGTDELSYVNDTVGSDQGRIKIYPDAQEVMEKILVENVLPQYMEEIDKIDNEPYGRVGLRIELNDKEIVGYGEYYYNGEEEMSDSYEMTEMGSWGNNEGIQKILIQLRDSGFTKGEVSYSGGGDSGEIYNDFSLSGPNVQNKTIDISKPEYRVLESLFYDCLESSYGGWEINEGSAGTIEVDIDDFTLNIYHTQYTDEVGSVDVDFSLKY